MKTCVNQKGLAQRSRGRCMKTRWEGKCASKITPRKAKRLREHGLKDGLQKASWRLTGERETQATRGDFWKCEAVPQQQSNRGSRDTGPFSYMRGAGHYAHPFRIQNHNLRTCFLAHALNYRIVRGWILQGVLILSFTLSGVLID